MNGIEDNCLFNMYNEKRILITGCSGFKGSWLSHWLGELGADVIGYALEPPSTPNLFDILDLKNKINYIKGDIVDDHRLVSIMEKYEPDFIFHLAAQPIVRISYENPKRTYETNVMGTVNVLEALRIVESVRACIIITSDKCYENHEWIYGYRENDPLGGCDPYSSSKGCAELVTQAYRESYFSQRNYGKNHRIALSSARSGNVIGGGDWGIDRIIPDCIKAFIGNDSVKIRNPNAIRPWQYILEPLYGYLLLGCLMYKEGAKYSGAWNFGPSEDGIITVENLVKLVIKYWGNGSYKIDDSENPHEAILLKLDASKAKMLLGWRQRYDIRMAVARTINWYKCYYKNMDTDKLSELMTKEIIDFSKLN